MQNVEMNNKFQQLFGVIYGEFKNPAVRQLGPREQWLHLKNMKESKEVKEKIVDWFKAYPDNEYVQALDSLSDSIEYYSRELMPNITIEHFETRMPILYLLKLWKKCDEQLHTTQDSGMGM